jgi:predicted DNA-binding transcriptional regulator AlpA
MPPDPLHPPEAMSPDPSRRSEDNDPVGITPRLIDVRQVGAMVGFSSRTVYRYADAGLMPAGRKIGALRRWDAEEIEKWLADGCPRVRSTARKQRPAKV